MQRGWGILAAATLFVAVAACFGDALENGFVSFDDPAYVIENPQVLGGLSPPGVRWAFTEYHAGMWHPLTWLSHMLDVELFGRSPAGHHAVNVFLHALNAGLLLWWLRATTGRLWTSLAVAAFFALHPLRVESVAWVAERKDVLSGSFWMATLLAYTAYARRPSRARYALVFGFLGLGLLAKPMLVTLPFVLLLVDFWPLGRWRASSGVTNASKLRPLVLEKLPLLALSVSFSIVAVLSQAATPALKSFETLPLTTRMGQAAIAYGGYLRKTLWPVDLAVFYPHPATQLDVNAFALRAAAAAFFLVGLSVLILRRSRGAAAVGWLWFLGSLVPVIGIVQVGGQGMADRYSYLPSVGLWIAICFSLAAALRRWPRLRPAGLLLGTLCLGAAAWQTRAQVATWSDSRTLFEQAIRATQDNHVAHASLGLVLLQEGDPIGARMQFERALRIEPTDANAHHNLGLLLMETGELESAHSHLLRAAEIQPDSPEPRAGMGDLLRRAGRMEEAVASYQEALERDPDYGAAHLNLGVAYFRLGRFEEASMANERALELNPRSEDALGNLATIAARQGQSAMALGYYQRVLELNPTRTRVRFHVAGLLMDLRRYEEALEQMQRVASEAPEIPEVQDRLQELERLRDELGATEERPGR